MSQKLLIFPTVQIPDDPEDDKVNVMIETELISDFVVPYKSPVAKCNSRFFTTLAGLDRHGKKVSSNPQEINCMQNEQKTAI